MKNCMNCGKQMSDNDLFCQSCGTKSDNPINPAPMASYRYCMNCSRQILASDNYCPYCGESNDYQGKNNNSGGKQVGFGCLGLCFPIVGLILYLVWMKDNPEKAKAAGIGALISLVSTVVLFFLSILLTMAFYEIGV